MRTSRLGTGVVAAALVAAGGCSVTGPSCLQQQQRGTVTSVSGAVGAGDIASHLVPYDTRGSQNDARISWTGQGTAAGPRLTVYATQAGCVDFTAPTQANPNPNQGDCRPIALAGGYLGPDGQLVPTSLTVTGPGNGQSAGFHEYKLFIVGDPAQTATYSIAISYFSGPDC